MHVNPSCFESPPSLLTWHSPHPRYEQDSRSVPCDKPGVLCSPVGMPLSGQRVRSVDGFVCMSFPPAYFLSAYSRPNLLCKYACKQGGKGLYRVQESDGRLAANPPLSCLMNYIVLIRWPVVCLSTYTNYYKRPGQECVGVLVFAAGRFPM